MSEEFFYRRQISRQHLEVLAQYMERYPALALASARSREGYVQSRRMWEKIARTLNRIDDSVNKNGRSWSRYWADFKCKIRRKYLVIQKCQKEGTHCTLQLNPLEERLVKILTDEEGNLLPTASVFYQMNSYLTMQSPLKGTGNVQLGNDKSLSNNDGKIDDSGGLDSADEQSQDDYLVARSERHTEHIMLPATPDKPHINTGNSLQTFCITDPIQIVVPSAEEKKPIEELNRELLEFELKKQKELFEMEKQFKWEKHKLEMSILRLKKQAMMKDVKNLKNYSIQ